MGSNTPNGYPYPVGTDRVMDGDDAIAALANAVDTKLGVSAAGTVNVTVSAGASGSATVTLPVGRFTAPPIVAAAMGVASTVWVAGGVSSITASSFNISIIRNDPASSGTGTLAMLWVARTPG